MKEENQSIAKAINMFGRVPEQWELLNEIERLNNIINEFEKEIKKEIDRTEELIIEDGRASTFGVIRGMLNEERTNWLYILKKLKDSDEE